MAYSALDLIEKELNHAIEQQTEVVANGAHIEDYAKYREHVGRICGLRSALREVQTLKRQEMDDDD